MDAIDAISVRGRAEREPDIITRIASGKVLVKMISDTGSWTTPSGKYFSSKYPFQLCDWGEANSLIENNPDRFIEGDPDDLKKFYGLEE